MKPELKSLVQIFGIIILFILLSYLVQSKIMFFQKFIGEGFFGMGVYVLLSIIAIVFTPFSATPLIPLASNLWGWVIAGSLSVLGWTIGSMIAFFIARRYGVKVIQRLISLNKLHSFEKKIPRGNLFWTIVFLRMILPVDFLSYALGLFSKVGIKTYFFATLIGITPFAFIFAYLGSLPILYQLVGLGIITFLFLVGFLIRGVLGKRKI